jgi:hypothetical protein
MIQETSRTQQTTLAFGNSATVPQLGGPDAIRVEDQLFLLNRIVVIGEQTLQYVAPLCLSNGYRASLRRLMAPSSAIYMAPTGLVIPA